MENALIVCLYQINNEYTFAICNLHINAFSIEVTNLNVFNQKWDIYLHSLCVYHASHVN